MPKEKGECPCSDCQIRARPPVGRPMEISPEAYQLLRNAAIPSEFKEVVRKVIPNMAMPYPPDLESPATSSEIDMTSIEMPTLRVSFPPVEMPVPSVPVSWPEMSTSDRGNNAFYLTDLTFDLREVGHMTPGLLQLAGCPIGQLMFCRAGDDEDEHGEEETVACDWIILTFKPEVKAAQLPPEGLSPEMQELVQLKDEEAFAGLTCKASVRVRFNTALNRLKVQMKVAATYVVSTFDGNRQVSLEQVVAESPLLEFAGTPGVRQETEKNVRTFGIRFGDMQLQLRAAEKKAAEQFPDSSLGARVITRVDQVGSEFVLVVAVVGKGEGPGECPDSKELRFNVRRTGKTQTEVKLVG